ncbi:uncharacterized protein LOC123316597 [Coccinella septempunctata]|uniref:uncharacterized protein LOC123316597 n=1 Tax=Coccinella septempunctata TaxID=41139 RepID=UPI001D096A05|nr:uncharacterized protein LOC123316597 [Coccinella septempunctata]
MFAVNFVTVCGLCLFLQVVSGKSLDLLYDYQEIEDSFPRSETNTEIKNLEFDRISDEAIAEICKNLKVTIHVKQPDFYVNCMEPISDMSHSVHLVKRDADALEGSGDPDEPATTTPSDVGDEGEKLDGTEYKTENASEANMEVPPEIKSSEVPTETSSANIPSAPTENPGSFQGGFDKILKNIPRQENNTSEDAKSSAAILNSSPAKDQVNLNGEEAQTGESQEKPSAASPNNMLLIVIGALGVIGALAFVYNFVKSRRESKEIDEVVRLETEGKELKEMKPLMRSPLAQNGSKSLEYIDADPQIQVSTAVRVEDGHNSK